MEIKEAINRAKQQISQSQYLRECCSGVYETGLSTAYQNKSDMLCTLLWHIDQLEAENAKLRESEAENE